MLLLDSRRFDLIYSIHESPLLTVGGEIWPGALVGTDVKHGISVEDKLITPSENAI